MSQSADARQIAARQREEVAAACFALASDAGFDAVTIEAVAAGAGVPPDVVRQHFDEPDELIEYVIVDEIGQIMVEVTILFGGGGVAPDVVVEVFAYTYRRLTETLTFRELLGPGRDRLMEHLRGDRPQTLILAQDFVAEELRTLSVRTGSPIEDPDTGAEYLIRLLVSLLVSPHLGRDLSEDGAVEAVARRWLLPGLFSA
jgi:AcrR family transcriptional regulator